MSGNTGEEKSIIPPHNEGAKKDIDHTVKAVDEHDARKLFMIARNRLVDVNRWHEYADGVSATFRLTDRNGQEVQRTAEKGDYFKIRVPAPGPAEGNGFDWVQIEAVEDKSNPEGHEEIMALRVRPAPSPQQPGESVAHFFDDRSTSSFVVLRSGNEVTAAVYGRNEVPNTATSNTLDKLRNAVVGASAILGFATVQWKNLVKGLVSGS